jgi:hypothetical protein
VDIDSQATVFDKKEVDQILSDPSIRRWKTTQPQAGYPNWWPRWRSPDIFVDNDGDRTTAMDGTFKYYQNIDEVGEPLKGTAHNRLFAIVRNLGTNAANDVQVMFSYAPYGVVSGTLYQHVHFKQIGVVYINLGPAGSPDAEKEIEVQWDLSDLTENNGGLWPATIAFFTHFCVKVEVNLSGDTDLSNNLTQHNFGNITSSSATPPIYMLITNADDKAKKAEFITQTAPTKLRLKLRGVDESIQPFSTPMWRKSEKTKKRKTVERKIEERAEEVLRFGSLSLRPREERLVTLSILPVEEKQEGREFGEVALRINDEVVGGVSFKVQKGEPRIGLLPREKMVHIPRHVRLPSKPITFYKKSGTVKEAKI